MNDFERKLVSEWRRLGLPINGAIVVGVSGGADSVALLVALDTLRRAGKLEIEIAAAHFNHSLRAHESDADEHFVKELCSARHISLACGRMKAPGKGNLEQSARESRYDFLGSVAENLKAVAVVTAHTMNDQAETFLQNLVRGSGLTGLGAMSPVREFSSDGEHGALLLVRPLIQWCLRDETEAYCRSQKIDFRYDSMNEDLRFNRVRIRKVLLPMLKDFNPNIISTIARTADLMREVAPRLGLEPAFAEQPRVAELKNMEESELKDYLRGWLLSVRGSLRGITSTHLQSIASLVTSRKSGRIAELPGKSRVLKNRGRLIFESEIV